MCFKEKDLSKYINFKYIKIVNNILNLIKVYDNTFKGNKIDLFAKDQNINYIFLINITEFQNSSIKSIYLEKNINTIH